MTAKLRALAEVLRELVGATEERHFVEAVGDHNGSAHRRLKRAQEAGRAAYRAVLDAQPAPPRVEPGQVGPAALGTWRCSQCGEPMEVDGSTGDWRWTGERYEHRHGEGQGSVYEWAWFFSLPAPTWAETTKEPERERIDADARWNMFRHNPRDPEAGSTFTLKVVARDCTARKRTEELEDMCSRWLLENLSGAVKPAPAPALEAREFEDRLLQADPLAQRALTAAVHLDNEKLRALAYPSAAKEPREEPIRFMGDGRGGLLRECLCDHARNVDHPRGAPGCAFAQGFTGGLSEHDQKLADAIHKDGYRAGLLSAEMNERHQRKAESSRPRVGVAVLVLHQGLMLLGKRGRGPNAGKWVIPGGGVEAGEHWRATGLRELREETGLTAEIIVERPWVMEILSGKPHRVTLCVRALIPGSGGPPPMPRAGSDLAEVRWFSAGELDALDVSPAVRPTLDDMLGARVRDGGRS